MDLERDSITGASTFGQLDRSGSTRRVLYVLRRENAIRDDMSTPGSDPSHGIAMCSMLNLSVQVSSASIVFALNKSNGQTDQDRPHRLKRSVIVFHVSQHHACSPVPHWCHLIGSCSSFVHRIRSSTQAQWYIPPLLPPSPRRCPLAHCQRLAEIQHHRPWAIDRDHSAGTTLSRRFLRRWNV